MPYLRSEWRDRIREAIGEYRVAREGLNRLKVQVAANAAVLHSSLSEHLPNANANLEGTYIVRAFAVFDAALRSYDRIHFQDPNREAKLAVMIDQLGALLHVPRPIRESVHGARRVRNYWAHELEEEPDPMSLDRIRGLLLTFLERLPKSWG